ncbi:hypothetical protein PBI_SCTP2_215 [Salicola phage SCTP-2]|nr:hypothetical protein PBI_SCTP2_215 [Salicola phage SCTP-2]
MILKKKYIEGAFNHIKSIFENKRELLNDYLEDVDTTKNMANIPDDVEVMAKTNRFVLLAMENRIEEPTDLFFELGKYYLEHYIKDQQ